MRSDIIYHFDFGSPNCYLVHKVVPGIEQRTGATVTYFPILLGGVMKLTNNHPPLIAFGEVKGKLSYMQRESERFVERYEISPYVFNPHFPINTLTLMRGAVAAQQLGCFERYVDSCFHAMWGEPRNMGDADVVREVLTAAGLPTEELLVLTQAPEVKQILIDNTAHSAQRGNFGAPTMFVGDEMFFGKENVPLVEQEVLRNRL